MINCIQWIYIISYQLIHSNYILPGEVLKQFKRYASFYNLDFKGRGAMV